MLSPSSKYFQTSVGKYFAESLNDAYINSWQEAQMSKRGRATLHVVENLAVTQGRSIEVIRNYTVEQAVCKFLSVFNCDCLLSCTVTEISNIE